MKKGQRLWTKEELLITLNLYSKTPFGKLHKGNTDVIHVSKLINRTPSAVAYKLVNFASLDPSLQNRGIKGMSNASKLDKQIWNEFYQNLSESVYESESLIAKKENRTLEELYSIHQNKKGEEKKSLVKRRVNQSFFRKMILASYNETCCITGLKQKELLIAGHIKPWSLFSEERLNPQNGISINSLHDRAFEVGLISINPDLKIIVSNELLKSKDEKIEFFFKIYHQKNMILPSKFLPDKSFLEYHFEEKFRG